MYIYTNNNKTQLSGMQIRNQYLYEIPHVFSDVTACHAHELMLCYFFVLNISWGKVAWA